VPHVDTLHLLEPVYRLINEQLLEQLGIQASLISQHKHWNNVDGLLHEIGVNLTDQLVKNRKVIKDSVMFHLQGSDSAPFSVSTSREH
jgi:hypothetical protein